MKKITAYKMLGQDFSCLDFQYEVGKTYEHEGEVEICEGGFHACENPMDCWSYYDITDSRYALVTLEGDTDKAKDDTKIAAGKITIEAELKLPDFIKRSIEWMLARGGEDVEVASGDYSSQASSGHSSSQASSGDSSRQASSGHSSSQASSGDYSSQASSGHSSRQASSGHSSRQASSGHSSSQASSGDYSSQASSGDYGSQASSGDSSRQASSGDYSRQASSGHSSSQASSGDYSSQASSGHSSSHTASGKHSVIASSGAESRAKGVSGTWICLAEFDNEGVCVGFATGCIGQDGLKEDTWYHAKDGRLVEA